MAITNYSQLFARLEEYSLSDDLKERIPDFIMLAEQHMFKKLRGLEQDTSQNLSTSTSDRFVALPTGYRQMRRLKIDVTGNGDYYDLIYKPVDHLRIVNSAGIPCYYTITDQIEMDRTSDVVYTVQAQFIKSPTALTSSNTTNDVLTNWPELYLYGSLWQLFLYTEEEEKAAKWYSQYVDALANANKDSRDRRYVRPAIYQRGTTP